MTPMLTGASVALQGGESGMAVVMWTYVLQVLHSGDLICEGFIKMLAEPAKPEEPKIEVAVAEPTEAAAPAADAAPATDAAPAEVCL